MSNFQHFYFHCDSCDCQTDVSCLKCNFYFKQVHDRVLALEQSLLNLKDVFDDCDDVDPVKTKVRLNMASAFDTALDCFDDCFSLDLEEIVSDYDRYNLPDQFKVDFFD